MKTTVVGTKVTKASIARKAMTGTLIADTHGKLVALAEAMSDQFSRSPLNAPETLALDLLQVAINQYSCATGLQHINFGDGISDVEDLQVRLNREHEPVA